MPARTCPEHGAALVEAATQYGPRWDCPEPGCTVACWGGPTSTPADALTRSLRARCHELFDPLWQRRTRFKDRDAAYRWLRRFMGLAEAAAHIGCFDKGQCRLLLAELEGPRP